MLDYYMVDKEIVYDNKHYTLLEILEGSEYLLVIEKDCKFPATPLIIHNIKKV